VFAACLFVFGDGSTVLVVLNGEGKGGVVRVPRYLSWWRVMT
jgi:alpha-tubulin suppressor-like RCC1 family protein